MRVGTARDVAELIGASLNTVYQLAQAGEIPTLRRIGVRLRFDLDEVQEWQRTRTPLPTTRAGTPRRLRLAKGAAAWQLTPEQVEALPTTGTVYFVRSTVGGGPIKIGLTRDVDKRLRALQAASPFPLVLLDTRPGGRRLEYELHEQFATHRHHGEWFTAAPVLDFLREAVA